RYSGKERDATGLYYYGFRYYAPWLGRWINPDPGGTVDGLNLYAFVGNNPLRYIDNEGFSKTDAERREEITTFVKNLSSAMKAVDRQNSLLEHAFEEKDMNRTTAKTSAFTVVTGIVTNGAGVAAGIGGGLVGTAVLPGIGTAVFAGVGALAAKTVAGKVMEKIGKETNLEPSITPKAAKLSWEKIKKGNTPYISIDYAKNMADEYNPSSSEGQKTYFKKAAAMALNVFTPKGATSLIALGKLAEERNDVSEGLSPMKINGLDTAYVKLEHDVTVDYNQTMENFDALETPVLYSTGGLFLPSELVQRDAIKKDMNIFKAKSERAQDNLARYRERQGWPT
ncbi:RHS repeat-associated core domain-containing protein, partial [Pseudomonas sp. NPDC087346]|uniref:RHS repeat-associated core domain-containing protein n=1 Tax=Pseudomonas sp. NPDC087346 TaxID=3364438 RepID=UPI0038273D3D